MQVPWPETDPLSLKVTQDGEEISLMTYRYPVPEGKNRKGVIFYIHGFGAYCEHNANQFKIFSDRGYECYALDQRGFGNSGGHRGLYESADQMYGDLYLFIYKTI
jgi:alpha-beta hydrolase superfamily lysophospholipase